MKTVKLLGATAIAAALAGGWWPARQAAALAPAQALKGLGGTATVGLPRWAAPALLTLGTLLAIVVAVPIAFLAARNTTPSEWLVRPIALLIIVSSRSSNSLIWALLLVTVLGTLLGVYATLARLSWLS